MRTLQRLNQSTTPAPGAMFARPTPLTRRGLRRLLPGLALAASLLVPHVATAAGDRAAPPAAADNHSPQASLALPVGFASLVPPAAGSLVPLATTLTPAAATVLPPAANAAPGDALPPTRGGRAAGTRR